MQESDFISSPEWRRIKADYENLSFQLSWHSSKKDAEQRLGKNAVFISILATNGQDRLIFVII
ncbi:hypothetical protein [Paenibacillus sacheonensis]|uniref:Uncharacterized protein n=1 Tax=Paenibacillus sacheonensis TaxID=742054 RepID=A0A7X4YP65_9BACL|nr:hypothetical protein [Paenibacillus sacheonensis]NBC69910.1 hypothetical protein [Paenibacillus sacheonensis]